jgi:hypothetical protein
VKLRAAIEDYVVLGSASALSAEQEQVYDTILALAMEELIPWFVKIPAKIALSRLPVGYQ